MFRDEQERLFSVLLVLFILSRLFLYLMTYYTADDAFITYRYAANIASGKGFVFNPEERVQGASSPLYTLVLAAIGFLLGPQSIPVASKMIGSISEVISFVLLWKILKGLSLNARFVACVLIAMYPKVVLVDISGMEASITVLLMILSAYYITYNVKPSIALVLLGVLLVTRLDSIAWVIVCIFWMVWDGLKVSWKAMAASIVPFAGWMMFSWVYFGSFLPHSAIAKRVSWSSFYPLFDPLRVLASYFPINGLAGFPTLAVIICVMLFLIPVFVEAFRLGRAKNFLAVFPIYFIVYNSAFSFGRTQMTEWYLLPGYFAYFIAIGTLCNALYLRFQKILRPSRVGRLAKPAFVIFLAAWLVVGANRWADVPAGMIKRQNRGVGIWLKDHAMKDASVLAEPIGYIGWESNLYIHDYVGLVSPAVTQCRSSHPTSDFWFLKYIKDVRPTYIVLRNWEIPTGQLFQGYGDGIFQEDGDREWFDTNYRETIWNPNASRDSPFLVIYQIAK